MFLKPEFSASQAYEMLAVAAVQTWGIAEAALLDSHLRSLSQAMATIAAVDVPEATEPLFGEDGPALDLESQS